MLLVSDIHGRFDALAEVASRGEPLLVLGDLINLVDYRTGEGIFAEVLGIDFARKIAFSRGRSRFEEMRALWTERVGDRYEWFRTELAGEVKEQYRLTSEALDGAESYVTYGNVDRPDMLRDCLPETARFVDGEVVVIEGLRVGFAGGGLTTPMNASGEVSDEEMAEKLAGLGEVDILCTHLAPAIPALHFDVVTGKHERASRPILEYLLQARPRYHFFGDVHQPQAHQWRVGPTLCRNVGYFRATRRPVRVTPDGMTEAHQAKGAHG